jgi:hypothetical protein
MTSNDMKRGRLGLIVMTVERARIIGVGVQPGTAVVGELRPDDRPPFHLCFASMDDLRTMIYDVMPREVTVEYAPGEDPTPLLIVAIRHAQGVMESMRPRPTVH